MSNNTTNTLLWCITFITISLSFLFTTVLDSNVLSAKMRLLNTQNIEVLKLWGHKDWLLEEVSVSLKVKNKGEIGLYGISNDVFNYPSSVVIYEIDGLSFIKVIKCNESMINYTSCINIGKDSFLGERLGLTFYTIQDIINHYDSIANFFKSFKMYPEYNYFIENNHETFLFVINQKSYNPDNIVLINYLLKEYVKTLPWRNYSNQSH